MDPSQIASIANGCTALLSGHYRKTARETFQAIADDPRSLVPNDHYGRSGVVSDVEDYVAGVLGKEAAVFMPSGTMAQPIALRIWADQADVPIVAFHPTCHLELHEHHGYRELHGLSSLLVGEADRLFTLADLEAVDFPYSSLLIELPQREIGGQLPTWEELLAILDHARARGARLHLDGARLWECGPYYGRPYDEIVAGFDSVYVSFYKILGGLPGAVLAGPADFIAEARIWQRRQGGNLYRQSANAITAMQGLEKHLPRMPEYVGRMGEIAAALRGRPGIRLVPAEPATNMVHLYLEGDPARLTEAGLQVAAESRVGLFFGVPPDGKLEISIGEASETLTGSRVRELFDRVFELSLGA